jgi:diguanylate cyclase (GGDEF)-like protein
MLRPERALLLPLMVCLIVSPGSSAFQAAVILALIGLAAVALGLHLRRLKAAERLLTQRLAETSAQLAAANRQLELHATTDPLTQLANHRRFSEFLDLEWPRALRERSSIALLLIDVDLFKPFNDKHGHQKGDACLRRVAAVIGSRVKRTSDLAARYGGEEFAVLLTGAEEDGALSVADWIRTEVAKQRIPHGASTVSPYVTVSIGVAIIAPLGGGPPERLIEDADAALDRAKQLGRNAVIASSSALRAREKPALE